MARSTGRYFSLLLLTLVFVSLFAVVRPHARRKTRQAAIPQAEKAAPSAVSTVHSEYFKDVKPLLAERCYSCHSSSRSRGGLRLDTVAFMRKGGHTGPAVVPGNSRKSLLLAAVESAAGSPRMPPTGKPLERSQIELLRTWINDGAGGSYGEDSQNPARNHWAYQPLKRPPLPTVSRPEWVANPIDAFIAAGHDRMGLTPSPPARKETLLRRVYLDLIGLPPTAEEVQAFLADPSDRAYEKIVDALLESPRHAERWARHWMDIWRYSDPDGRKLLKDTYWSHELIWRWRDWIIRSLQEDKGYDRMIQEMLAGDELAPDDPVALAATGFLARNLFKLSRNVWLSNTVEHTGKAFLGLTLNCARCHDHKTDPISQQEYYRFRALFEPHDIRTDQYPLEPGGKPIGLARAFDADPTRPTYVFRRGDETNPDQSISITPGVPEFLGGPLRIEPVRVPGSTSTGRRLALARWICDPRNPLTARVAVNHIWARHFGTGLVDTPSDFGMRCKPPLHLALLDYLAVELQTSNWSMKKLHRLIVTSNLYRMQSMDSGSQSHSLDPENQYLWRMSSRRMEAEVLRDSLLSLAGNLDLSMGGPPLEYPEAEQASRRHHERRSLYYRYSRDDKMGFLEVFDPASVDECYRRDVSIVPQQALALVNSGFVWNQARQIARRLSTMNDADFVSAAFTCILCRPPTGQEQETCERFLSKQRQLLADPGRLTPFPGPDPAGRPSPDARDSLIHVLLNHNDFVTIR
jgi:Protein of unknown function (DUF1553)/Protein of unknown function (DUF1549)/Planctomycete cytochrome C